MKLGKLSFGFSAVNAGQKSSTVNASPTLTVNSTEGKFTVTAAVSSALGVAVGENIQFINNLDEVKAAIQQENPIITNWATENGVDLNSQEGVDEAIATFSQWAIAKGHPILDKTGAPVMASVRLTKEEKNAYANEHAEEILSANHDALVAAAIEAGETDTENPEVLAKYVSESMINFPKVPALAGSKTSTSGSATGVGLPLSFTDSAVWHALKADLGENAVKKNRIFDVVLKKTTIDDDEYAPFTVGVNDGQKVREITAYPIIFNSDVNPVARNKKD